MTYNKDDMVYHDLNPEWGYGYVHTVYDESILVYWPDRPMHRNNCNIFMYYSAEVPHLVHVYT